MKWTNILGVNMPVDTLVRLRPLLLVQINFNPSIDKYAKQSVRWNYLSIPNFIGSYTEVKKWISNSCRTL